MDQVSEIKQKIDIVDLVGGYVDIKKAGRNYKGLCPFHSEKTPSFMVSPELQIYKCFGCGESGDIFSFVQKIEGVEFPDALETLAEKAGVKLVKKSVDPQKSQKDRIFEINHIASEYYHYILTKHKVGVPALKYLKSERKFGDEVIEEFNLGYSPNAWSSLFDFLVRKKYSVEDILVSGVAIEKKSGKGCIDKFRGRIIFPLTGIDGKVYGFNGRTLFDKEPKYLNSAETLVFHKGSYLYGLSQSKIEIKKKGVVFVEGPTDVISAHRIGVKNVVASSGTSLTLGQLRIISRYTKNISFCFDSDVAGLNAALRAIDLAKGMDFNVSVIMVPEKYKDLDEYIKAEPDEAKKLFSNAVPVYDFFLVAAMKKHDKNTAAGKKNIVADLASVYKRISNPVEFDFYVKKVAELLDIREEVVSESLRGENVRVVQKEDAQRDLSDGGKKISAEEYMLCLLLRASLEDAQTLLYKLGQKDFVSEENREVFSTFKNYLLGRKRKFNITHFINRLEGALKGIANDMYLRDFGDILESDERFLRELNNTFDRLKRDTTKRDLRDLTQKIKEAEIEKDTKSLNELTKKFKELSEKLV